MKPPSSRRALPALLLALVPLAACNPSAQDTGATTPQPVARKPSALNVTTPQAAAPKAASSFDHYLLELSWSPEYCQSHATAAECAAHDAFVLHGLWPENADGTYPSNCSDAPGPQNPSQYNDLYPEPDLLQHEWQTHGTCTGLAPDAYFQTVRAAYKSVTIPPAFRQLTTQISLTPAQIQTDFTTSNASIPQSAVVVSCGNNYLTAVGVCLDKSLQPIACPAAVHTCHANIVRIPAPQ